MCKPIYFFLAALLLAAFTACTSTEQKVVVIPTLAILPTETATLGNSPTPTLTVTPSATHPPTVTPTPTVSNTPIPTNAPPCATNEWWKQAEPLVIQFLDESEVAAHTSRISLSSVVLQMRQTEREFERMDYPDCLAFVEQQLSDGMNAASQGYSAFMAEDDFGSSYYLGRASQYFWDASEALRNRFIFADIRLADTSVFIWGGDAPNALTATAMANEFATIMAGSQATVYAALTPTATFTSTGTPAPPTTPPSSGIGISNPSHILILRSGPDDTFSQITLVSFGSKVVILRRSEDGNWLNIQLSDGREGWVHAADVIFQNP